MEGLARLFRAKPFGFFLGLEGALGFFDFGVLGGLVGLLGLGSELLEKDSESEF